MALRNKSAYSKKKTNAPLYSLSNEELETRNKQSDDENLRGEIAEIFRLRRIIEVLSQAKDYSQFPSSILVEDETEDIMFYFASSFTSPLIRFLSHYGDTGGKGSAFPLWLHLRISDTTTLEEIKESWVEIKYWRDYIHRAQMETYATAREKFLADLHTQNMAGTGYRTLAKQVNQRLETLLHSEASNQKWIKKFEKELRAYLSKQKVTGNKNPSRSSRGSKKAAATKVSSEPPSSDFSKIKRIFRYWHVNRIPEEKKRWLDFLYKEAPLKCLSSIPEKNLYGNLEAEALVILSHLGYTKAQGEEAIQTAMQAIAEGRDMKNMVTANRVRETLRWWRHKYGLPSPEKAGVG